MRRHMMCEFAAEQGAAGTVLNACDALAGLISASWWVFALKIGVPPLGLQPKRAAPPGPEA